MKYEIKFKKEELSYLVILLAKQRDSASTQEEKDKAKELLSKIKYAVLHSPIIVEEKKEMYWTKEQEVGENKVSISCNEYDIIKELLIWLKEKKKALEEGLDTTPKTEETIESIAFYKGYLTAVTEIKKYIEVDEALFDIPRFLKKNTEGEKES